VQVERAAVSVACAKLSGVTESEPARTTLSTRSVRSFDDFYREHAVELHRAVTLAVGSSDLAREAVDEAMTRAYARWRTVGAYDRPAGWVYRVAVNWATSRFRKRRRESLDPFVPGTATETAGVAHDVSSPDPALARAMAGLSTEHRSVVVLRYLLDWSEAETAAALGVATGTVKSRLNRALARLADELDTDARPTPRTSADTTDIDRPGGLR
jgi:RNA polymerase sigma factor (sigma-70 family)